ncbi:hypothetical protein Tco_1283452 [Tanacetum coccineum]
MDPPGDIMVPTTPLKKSLIPVSIGRLFIEMPMTWSHSVTLVNVKAKSRNLMRCLKTQFKFAKDLLSMGIEFMAHSRLQREQVHILVPLTTCQNGLKRKRSPLMMLELFDYPDYEDSRARGFVQRSLGLHSFACLFWESYILDLID